MGYFSNGTEGMIFQDRYCSRCVHDVNNDCPIWLMHLLWSSEQFPEYEKTPEAKTLAETKRAALDLLMPGKETVMSDGVVQELNECAMFHARSRIELAEMDGQIPMDGWGAK